MGIAQATTVATGLRPEARFTDFEHTGPGTLAGRFLRSGWQPIQRSHDLPKGRAKPIRLMSEDFTLYRGESGAPYLVGQRCAHRGTQLSGGWVEGDDIRCLYHGWKYDGAGQCNELPAGPAAMAATIRIASYPVREHLGLVFAFLGEGEPPPFPHIPAFELSGEDRLESWVEHFPRTGGMHPKFPELPEMSFDETSYGLRRTIRTREGRVQVSPFFMPNVLRTVVPSPNFLQGHGPRERDSYLMKVPVDDGSHVFFIAQHVRIDPPEKAGYLEKFERYLEQRANARPPEEIGLDILAGRSTLLDHVDHPYLAVIEDVVAQGGQGAIANRTEENLCRSDAGIVAMRRVWSREMRAIDEGRAPKAWRFTGGAW
jgi:5,5'-dehydrodivanillate O-demethylase